MAATPHPHTHLARTTSVTMQHVTEPTHLANLWDRCRASNHRLTIHRCNPKANGTRDEFIVAVHHPDNTASLIEVRTTNLESAATLILDRYGHNLNA